MVNNTVGIWWYKYTKYTYSSFTSPLLYKCFVALFVKPSGAHLFKLVGEKDRWTEKILPLAWLSLRYQQALAAVDPSRRTQASWWLPLLDCPPQQDWLGEEMKYTFLNVWLYIIHAFIISSLMITSPGHNCNVIFWYRGWLPWKETAYSPD